MLYQVKLRNVDGSDFYIGSYPSLYDAEKAVYSDARSRRVNVQSVESVGNWRVYTLKHRELMHYRIEG